MISFAQPLREAANYANGDYTPAADQPTPVQTPQAQDVAKTPSFTDWLGSPEAMALAAGFLKASGPSNVPVSMGQAMGMGMEEMLKAKLQFGNQNLDKDKFGYQQKHDKDVLDLQNKRFGVEDQRYKAQEQNWKDQRRLQEAQMIQQAALNKDRGSKYKAEADLATIKSQNMKKSSEQADAIMAGFIPPSTTPAPDSGSLIPIDGVQATAPQVPTAPTQQPGILNSVGTPQNLIAAPAQQVGMLNNKNPLSQLDQTRRSLVGMAVLNQRPDYASKIINEGTGQDQWERVEGFNESGKPSMWYQNKTTGVRREIPGTPAALNLNFESRKQQIQEENKMDQELRGKVFEQSFILDKFQNIRNLLNEDSVKTGAGFDQITYLKNIANTMGLDIDQKKLNDAQYMKQQINAAFSDYQRGTRIPGIGSQSDLEFDALKQQFVRTDLTPDTLRNVMNAFEKNIMIKREYLDFKQSWKNKFGNITENDPSNGLSFEQVWRRWEKGKYYGGKKK